VITFATKATSSEEDTTFTTKEITIIAATWPLTVEELASVLEVDAIPDDEEATDTDNCSIILQEWLRQSCGDRRKMLAAEFERKEYHSMAELIVEF
jgi:hypothetical protein